MVLRVRRLTVLLLVCAALLPALLLPGGAGASQPRFDFTVGFASRGAPEPGVPFELVATARADTDGRIDLRLSVPDGVRIEGSPRWQADIGPRETHQRVWTLVATQEGLWSARLLEGGDDADQRTRACCLYARTFEGDSTAAENPLDALTPLRVDHSLQATAVGAETVELIYAVTPEAPWTQPLRLVLAFATDSGRDPAVFDSEPASISKNVALADGGRVTVPLFARGVAFFHTAGGPLEDFAGESIPLRCVRAVLERSGDNVAWVASEPCHGSAMPAAVARSLWRHVPAPGALPTLALVALARLLSRRAAP